MIGDGNLMNCTLHWLGQMWFSAMGAGNGCCHGSADITLITTSSKVVADVIQLAKPTQKYKQIYGAHFGDNSLGIPIPLVI